MAEQNAKLIEIEVMAHRYLYYVEDEPVITDLDYDMLERQAQTLLPETSPVHAVGSSLRSSYKREHIERAEQLRK